MNDQFNPDIIVDDKIFDFKYGVDHATLYDPKTGKEIVDFKYGSEHVGPSRDKRWENISVTFENHDPMKDYPPIPPGTVRVCMIVDYAGLRCTNKQLFFGEDYESIRQNPSKFKAYWDMMVEIMDLELDKQHG